MVIIVVCCDIGFLGEDADGSIEDGVVRRVVAVHVNTDVGSHAKLGEPSLRVHDGT